MDMAIKNGWTNKMTLAFKQQWVLRRERLIAEIREDGKQPPEPETDVHNPTPVLDPETSTVKQVLQHLNQMEQERRSVSVDLPRKSYRRSTGFPQLYDRSTGELSREWRGIWPQMCDECRDRFMEVERAAWVEEEDNVETGRQDSPA
jgi:hypothetical protein